MATAKTVLYDVLTPDAYRHLEELRTELAERAHHILGRYRIPGYVSAYGAKGAVVFSPVRIRDYRDFARYDSRFGHAHWLYQHNGGVFLPPWGKMEQWTLSVQHTADDIDRIVANLDRFARDITSLRSPATPHTARADAGRSLAGARSLASSRGASLP